MGVKSLFEVENALLTVFQMFYYLNRRFPLTNGLPIVPYGEMPEDEEKIILKQLYEMFKDTNSHRLVSLQLLCALGIYEYMFGLINLYPEVLLQSYKFFHMKL